MKRRHSANVLVVALAIGMVLAAAATGACRRSGSNGTEAVANVEASVAPTRERASQTAETDAVDDADDGDNAPVSTIAVPDPSRFQGPAITQWRRVDVNEDGLQDLAAGFQVRLEHPRMPTSRVEIPFVLLATEDGGFELDSNFSFRELMSECQGVRRFSIGYDGGNETAGQEMVCAMVGGRDRNELLHRTRLFCGPDGTSCWPLITWEGRTPGRPDELDELLQPLRPDEPVPTREWNFDYAYDDDGCIASIEAFVIARSAQPVREEYVDHATRTETIRDAAGEDADLDGDGVPDIVATSRFSLGGTSGWPRKIFLTNDGCMRYAGTMASSSLGVTALSRRSNGVRSVVAFPNQGGGGLSKARKEYDFDGEDYVEVRSIPCYIHHETEELVCDGSG